MKARERGIAQAKALVTRLDELTTSAGVMKNSMARRRARLAYVWSIILTTYLVKNILIQIPTATSSNWNIQSRGSLLGNLVRFLKSRPLMDWRVLEGGIELLGQFAVST